MATRPLRLALSLLPLLLTSCVEFESQTVTFRHDVAADELRIFQVYEGIYVPGGEFTDADGDDLQSVVQGQRTFFFNNWLTEYDEDYTRRSIEDLAEKMLAAPDELFPEIQAQITLRDALVRCVEVTNGDFYLNGGRLCAYQAVRVKDVSGLIRKMNRAAQMQVRSSDLAELDEAARRQVLDFNKKGEWVTLRGNELKVRLYATPDRYEELAQFFGSTHFSVNGQPLKAKLFHQNPFVTLCLGHEECRTSRLHADNLFPDGVYNDLALKYVRRNWEVREGLDLNAIRDHYLKTGKLTREPPRDE